MRRNEVTLWAPLAVPVEGSELPSSRLRRRGWGGTPKERQIGLFCSFNHTLQIPHFTYTAEQPSFPFLLAIPVMDELESVFPKCQSELSNPERKGHKAFFG